MGSKASGRLTVASASQLRSALRRQLQHFHLDLEARVPRKVPPRRSVERLLQGASVALPAAELKEVKARGGRASPPRRQARLTSNVEVDAALRDLRRELERGFVAAATACGPASHEGPEVAGELADLEAQEEQLGGELRRRQAAAARRAVLMEELRELERPGRVVLPMASPLFGQRLVWFRLIFA